MPVETRGLVSRAMDEQFSALQPLWVEQHLNLLCELRRLCGGDLDMPIILGMIGQRIHQAALLESHSYQRAQAGGVAVDHARLTNVESIVQASGIPRETVRRKVLQLIARGWLDREPRGRLMVTPALVGDMAPATAASTELLEVMFEALARALAARGQIAIAIAAQD